VPAIDVIVAIQTKLLDTVPRVTLCSELECDECIFLPAAPRGEGVDVRAMQRTTGSSQTIDTPGCVMWRFDALNTSYVEMVHPHDFVSVRITADGRRHAVRWDLMGHFMEKGVIRRLQSRGALVPLESDQKSAAAAYAEFTHRPPPLTT